MTPVLIAITISAILLLITIITVAVRIERRLNRLETKIGHLHGATNQVIRQSNGMLGLFGALIGLLARREIIAKEEIGGILRDFTEIGRISEIHPNPLSIEETHKLNEYIRQARQGGTFTRGQAEEYNRLVRILEEENPNDPNILPLVALAAVLLGLYLASRR